MTDQMKSLYAQLLRTYEEMKNYAGVVFQQTCDAEKAMLLSRDCEEKARKAANAVKDCMNRITTLKRDADHLLRKYEFILDLLQIPEDRQLFVKMLENIKPNEEDASDA